MYTLGLEQRQSTITERALARVAREIGDVMHVGLMMDFSQAQIQQYQCNSPHSVSNQTSHMFSAWRARLATAATVETFVGLMREAEVDDTMVKRVITEEYAGGVINRVNLR